MSWKSILGIAFLLVISACTKSDPPPTAASTASETAASAEHQDPDGYYTCTMHPEIHMHEPGKCPICGMPLVKTKAKQKAAQAPVENAIPVSPSQMKLGGMEKYTVTRKAITHSIPVAGRILGSREIAVQVYESDLDVIKVGSRLEGSVTAAPDEILTGRVTRVDSLTDPSSRTVRVVGQLDRAPSRVLGEGGFQGEIKTSVDRELVIPVDSVLHAGRRDLVYIFAGENQLKPTEVKVGRKAGEYFPVLSGLKEGDVISGGPNFLLDSEARIRGLHD